MRKYGPVNIHLDHFREVRYENLAITHPASAGRLEDRLHDEVERRVGVR